MDIRDEADVSTEHPEAKKYTWLSCAHEIEERPESGRATQSEGSLEVNDQRRAIMNRGTIPISAEVVKSHGTRRSLKKHEILRGHKQFNRVITGGRSLLGELLRCFVSASGYGEDPGRDIVKVGFTVSRKIRRSTVRNRLKRIMREVYRMHRERLHQLAIRKSQRLELVLLYRGNSDADPKKVPYELIEKDFLRIVDRLERGLDGAGFV